MRLPAPDEAAAVLAYFVANRDHLAPWDPPHPPGFLTVDHWRAQLARNREDCAADRSLRLFVFARDPAGPEPIGTCNFSNFVRGAFQACHLGYTIDHRHEGRGLMGEAVEAGVRFVFETLRLHRVMANYVPTNERSARLLKRLGFTAEGFARDYLFLAGEWRDHVLTARTNPDPAAPRPG